MKIDMKERYCINIHLTCKITYNKVHDKVLVFIAR